MRYTRGILSTIGLGVLLIGIPNVRAAAPTPGSADDPVVTKSYLEQYVQGLGGSVGTGGGSNSLTESKIKEIIAQEIAKLPTNNGGGGTSSTGQGNAMKVVTLKAGQTILADAGSELIVRNGKTLAVSNDDNGIPDVTAGKDLAAGTVVQNNHLLIFPRDGRGVKPDLKETADVYVMVRGGYVVQNADGSKVPQ
ncbi:MULTISPECIES: hypothetical protein [unclassified Paenibacillus]|uniref:hypothetical protein n=1 Tax=unclassified Paenibacillus TaxID=185978 RepID=UPI00020D6E27|nr:MULTISPECIES: hypothetical protein [unclassified Paenibacillus]EGL13650.1 hypothetical protein HMPREF9413_0519 [Paenibacillus sp. HGF7]EPD86230.1 hypothetical protein HMPREF1207_02806 [Paenibacillus sp. HGH0039]